LNLEILCINDIDTPSGAEYIVMAKLNVVFSQYERKGRNEKNEFDEIRDGRMYDFDNHGLGFHTGLAPVARTQSGW
jgi:hypothetical protein